MTTTMELDLSELGLDASAIIAGAESNARGIGKERKELQASIIRPLTILDVKSVGTASVGVSESKQIKHLRDSHHEVAKRIALGMSNVEISVETGYTSSRISVLKADPLFQELVASYREIQKTLHVNTLAKYKNVADDSLGILQNRLIDEPETFTNKQLMDIAASAGDRAGYSPVQRSESLQVVMSPEDLERVKSQVRSNQSGKVKQISRSTIDAEFTVVPESERASMGETVRTPGDLPNPAQNEGVSGQGSNVREFSREENSPPN